MNILQKLWEIVSDISLCGDDIASFLFYICGGNWQTNKLVNEIKALVLRIEEYQVNYCYLPEKNAGKQTLKFSGFFSFRRQSISDVDCDQITEVIGFKGHGQLVSQGRKYN